MNLSPFRRFNRSGIDIHWNIEDWCSSVYNKYIPTRAIVDYSLGRDYVILSEPNIILYHPFAPSSDFGKTTLRNDFTINREITRGNDLMEILLNYSTGSYHFSNADNIYVVTRGKISTLDNKSLVEIVIDSNTNFTEEFEKIAIAENVSIPVKVLIASELFTLECHKKLLTSLMKYFIKPTMQDKYEIIILPSDVIYNSIYTVCPPMDEDFENFQERRSLLTVIPQMYSYLLRDTAEVIVNSRPVLQSNSVDEYHPF